MSNDFHRVKVPGTLRDEKNKEKAAEDEIPEVDDKLIGDDLGIQEAQEGCEDKETPIKKDEDNY